MKVLDLHCSLGHAFEGWFAGEDDFIAQCERHLLQCPMCGSTEVRKVLSAPRLNLRGARASSQAMVTSGEGTSEALPGATGQTEPSVQALQARWLQLARHVIAHTEDVGERFATEARRMHHQEIPERGIRGQASAREAEQLLEEGIAVLPMLIPEAAKSTLQ